MNIDEKFYKGKEGKPKGTTVKELKSLLEELPDELKIMQDYPEEGFMLTVYNIKDKSVHLGIGEIDEW